MRNRFPPTKRPLGCFLKTFLVGCALINHTWLALFPHSLVPYANVQLNPLIYTEIETIHLLWLGGLFVGQIDDLAAYSVWEWKTFIGMFVIRTGALDGKYHFPHSGILRLISHVIRSHSSGSLLGKLNIEVKSINHF